MRGEGLLYERRQDWDEDTQQAWRFLGGPKQRFGRVGAGLRQGRLLLSRADDDGMVGWAGPGQGSVSRRMCDGEGIQPRFPFGELGYSAA